jgi:HEAT repeat protein
VHRICLLAALWLTLCPTALAQLDLPNQMEAARRERASQGRRGGLILPRTRTADAEKSPERVEAQPVLTAEPAPLPVPELPVGLNDRAAALVAELAAIEGFDGDRSRAIAAQLETLGAPGLTAARASLPIENATAMTTAARVMLRIGSAEDRGRIEHRLDGRFPGGAAAPFLQAVAESDPTYLTDAQLVKLLDHSQGQMRSAAERRLEQRARAALLPELVSALESERTDTRQRAVELVAGVNDPAVIPLLVNRLGDESARVAFRAAELLAALSMDGVVEPLLERVQASSRLFREDAYALLAIVEREDRLGIGILDTDHVPSLLENLRGVDVFGRGCAAVALAGIGFRAVDREATAWLAREVPSQLVAAVVGSEFHADFSSLQRPARRRLGLISGERFGADGPAWARWWVDNADDFNPRRATMEVEPGDEKSLSLAVRGTLDGGEAFVLVGPEADQPASVMGEVIFIGPDEAQALVRQLGRTGVFGAERLPGHYGTGGAVRTLEVQIADQRKRFTFSTDAVAAWADELIATARELHRGNRWQRYYDSERYASRREFWAAERPWWVEPRTAEERRERQKELLLDVLGGARSGDRDRLVEELEILAAGGETIDFADYPKLARVLSNELFFGDRASKLLDLALLALSDTSSGLVDPESAGELFDDVFDLFRETALDGLERILASTDSTLAARLARDPRPAARGVAARRLATLGGEDNIVILRELLDDEIEIVQASTVEAIGRAGLDELSTEVLIRARIGTQLVRAAALRAAGRIGADGSRDAMLAALGAGDALLQRAAVEGLAELRDPSTAALMTSFVRRGQASPLYSEARAGLLALGDEAWPEIKQMALSERMDVRREAGLLLSEQGAADAVPILLQVLFEDSRDSRVLQELAILTCVDFREDAEPERSWSAWWENAVQDGSLAWFRGAQERAGVDPAPIGSLEGNGTLEGASSLVETLALDGRPLVAQRAERELERLLDREVSRPANPELEADWRELLRQEIDEHYR